MMYLGDFHSVEMTDDNKGNLLNDLRNVKVTTTDRYGAETSYILGFKII